jgi:hypothetical protein
VRQLSTHPLGGSMKYLITHILFVFVLATFFYGCVTYRTRLFENVEQFPTFENWAVNATVQAFAGTWNASSSDHSYSIYAGVWKKWDSRMNAYATSEYSAHIDTFLIFARDSTGLRPLELDSLTRYELQGKGSNISAKHKVFISPEIEELLAHVRVTFKHSMSDSVYSEGFEIKMRRYESSHIGLISH